MTTGRAPLPQAETGRVPPPQTGPRETRRLSILHVTAGRIFGGIETMLCAIACVHDGEATHHFAVSYPGRLSDELRATGREVAILGPMRISRAWTVCRSQRSLRRL